MPADPAVATGTAEAGACSGGTTLATGAARTACSSDSAGLGRVTTGDALRTVAADTTGTAIARQATGPASSAITSLGTGSCGVEARTASPTVAAGQRGRARRAGRGHAAGTDAT